MINGDLAIFLDTGWYMESTFFYNGYIYWFEGFTEDDNLSTVFVNRWKASIDEEYYYHEYRKAGETIDYSMVFKEQDYDFDKLKHNLLTNPFFGGKTFWQIESRLIWAEEGEPILI